jgi:hypothetical protein
MGLEFFEKCIFDSHWGDMPRLYEMIGAHKFYMQIKLEPEKIYEVNIEEIFGKSMEFLFFNVNGDGGYNGTYPTIDLNYLNNPRKMYDPKESFRIFTSRLQSECSDKPAQESTLLMMLCLTEKTDRYGDKFLLDFLIESIRYFLREKYDLCVVNAHHVTYTRVRVCSKKLTKIRNKKVSEKYVADLMPSCLREARRCFKDNDRNPVEHTNIKEHTISREHCARILSVSILSFHCCRYLEDKELSHC